MNNITEYTNNIVERIIAKTNNALIDWTKPEFVLALEEVLAEDEIPFHLVNDLVLSLQSSSNLNTIQEIDTEYEIRKKKQKQNKIDKKKEQEEEDKEKAEKESKKKAEEAEEETKKNAAEADDDKYYANKRK